MTKTEELLYIMGVATHFIIEFECKTDKQRKLKDWVIEAMSCIVYKDEALPPLPELIG
jgi:hypothetical protein